jgi:hypothetical protein
MLTMTANELMKVLQQAIDAGEGDCEVMFDSEAQKFRVHMVDLSAAHFQPKDTGMDYAFVSLHYNFEGNVERPEPTWKDIKEYVDSTYLGEEE